MTKPGEEEIVVEVVEESESSPKTPTSAKSPKSAKKTPKKKKVVTRSNTQRGDASLFKLPAAVGRGRAGSNPCSPVPGNRQFVVEQGIPLSQIPWNAGPAAGARRRNPILNEAVVGLEDPAYDEVEEEQAVAVEREVRRQERRNRLLENQKRLAVLQSRNAQLELDISRQSDVNARPTSHIVQEVVEPGASARLSQTEDTRQLPTLAQLQEDEPTLTSLRARPGLQAQVDQHIEDNDLWQQPAAPPGNFNPSGYPGNGTSLTSLTSGRSVKAESGVRRQVVWPHTRLEGRLQNPSFDKLSLPLLVIGELGVIQGREVTEAEREARVKQLRRLCTFATKSYEWDTIREYHGAFLASAERQGNWEIDTNELASQYIFACGRAPQARPQPVQRQFGYQQQQFQQQVVQQQPRRSRSRSGHFFCSKWNRGQCVHAGKHNAVIAGKLRPAEHFCAWCWLEYGEINNHPELECPRKVNGAGNGSGNNGGPAGNQN